MTVAAILALKGRDVVTTSADRTIAEVVRVLADQKIGALVVVENGDRIVGIVSERDIVKSTAAKGAAMLDEMVGAIMTRNVVTCSERETINDVMGRMTRGRFRHLPVAAGGRLTGIVSIGDVVKARLEEVQREADEMRTYIATA
jgi:CBS domain-containing protein